MVTMMIYLSLRVSDWVSATFLQMYPESINVFLYVLCTRGVFRVVCLAREKRESWEVLYLPFSILILFFTQQIERNGQISSRNDLETRGKMSRRVGKNKEDPQMREKAFTVHPYVFHWSNVLGSPKIMITALIVVHTEKFVIARKPANLKNSSSRPGLQEVLGSFLVEEKVNWQKNNLAAGVFFTILFLVFFGEHYFSITTYVASKCR